MLLFLLEIKFPCIRGNCGFSELAFKPSSLEAAAAAVAILWSSLEEKETQQFSSTLVVSPAWGASVRGFKERKKRLLIAAIVQPNESHLRSSKIMFEIKPF